MTQEDKNTLFRMYFLSVYEELDGNTNSFVKDLLSDFIIKNNLEDELSKWLRIK